MNIWDHILAKLFPPGKDETVTTVMYDLDETEPFIQTLNGRRFQPETVSARFEGSNLTDISIRGRDLEGFTVTFTPKSLSEVPAHLHPYGKIETAKTALGRKHSTE